KTLSSTLLLAVVTMLAGSAHAQTQPAAPAKKPTTPAKSQPANAAKAPAKTPAKTGTALSLTTRKDKFSYALGMNFGQGIGERLKQEKIEFDPAIVARAVRDALSGAKLQLTDEQAKAVLMEVQTEVAKKHQELQKQLADKNKAAGDAYLAANKAKPGVVTLPDGLQYKILTPGTGPKPAGTDTVVANYKGTFVDGKEFDNSYKRNEPITIPVTGVIKGWTEALQLMPVGSKWQLAIPSDLAYGEHARPEIGPNQTLVFEVELLSIKPKEEAKPDAPTPAPSTPAGATEPAQSKPADKPQQ
ncbi:MAG TPA: FKBP-type peptidyl-prolyl cis-trans isomerase, partial [Terriglobales bacterium]|nr:FKBP-type peptidyl-prolyl cis-trans isomerase [Terriglobales bacterium]